MIIFKYVIFLGFLFTTIFSFAYKKDQLIDYQKKYDNQMAVVLNHNQLVTIKVDSKTGELIILETDYEEVLYLKESAKFYTSKNIYTSDFFEDIVDISVTVFNENGSKHRLTNDEFQIVDSPPSSWVFHDDNKELLFDLESLGEGYRTVITYTKRIKRAEFFDVFHFMSVYPVENALVEIIQPAGVELKFYEQNLEKYTVKKQSTPFKKKTIKHAWLINDLEEYETQEGSTNIKNHIPHLIAQIVSYTVKGEKNNLIGTTDELHSFFQEFLLLGNKSDERTNGKGNDEDGLLELKKLVNELTEGIDTDLEKIDTIFRWVQTNIKYIAFEDGINGYVPRSCNTVMGNRYGDCKDMGNLLVEMLTIAEVEGAHVAWVGTRDIPYLMSEIPTPLACNHVICVVDKEDGDYYYLDATSAEVGYLLPPRDVQSKELLIHTGLDKYTLFKVPEVDAKNNYLKSVIRFHWDDDDSLRGTGIDYYNGYERENRTYYLANLDNEDLYDYVKELVLGGVNRYTLGEYDIRNLDHKNETLEIEYDFSVDNLFIEDNGDLILNPTLFKPRVSQYNEEDHSMVRYKKYHRTVDYQFEFDIPKGYEVKFLPENNSYTHDLFQFNSTFSIKENTIIIQMKYNYELLEIPPSLYPAWNEFSIAINSATIQNIILQKI